MQEKYDIKSIMEEIEKDLIVRMKRTLWSHKEDEKTKGFNWPQWQALKLKQFEEYKEANKELFNEKTKPLNKYLYKHIKEQFKEGASRTNKEAIKAGFIKKEDSQLGGSFFGLNHRKLGALIKSTKEDMEDIKYATLRMANDQYRQIIYKAQVYVNTGVGTVKQAIDMATKDFLAKGFNCIEYKDGSRHNIADYCDMAIRTANKRANLMGEGEMRKKLGNPLVYISKHGGACDKCTPWEGRVYIDNVWSGGTENDGKYPMLSTAIEGGLFHPRCQHGSSTYYEGINDEPEEVIQAKHSHNENDKYTQYLQQRQKQYERLALGSLLPENVINYQSKAKELQRQINNSKIEGATEIPTDIKEFYDYYKKQTDKILIPRNLNKILEYDQLPIIVSKTDFNKLAKNNKYGILERGFKTGKGTLSMDTIIDNYKNGDFYVGEGIYGSGTYTAYGKNAHKIALSYANNEENLSTEKNVIQYLLKDDAKVIKYSDLQIMRDKELDKLIEDNGFKDYFDVIDNGFKNIKTTEVSQYIMEMQDVGVYASIKGYDAIEVIQEDSIMGEGFNYIVILNRKKMIMYD